MIQWINKAPLTRGYQILWNVTAQNAPSDTLLTKSNHPSGSDRIYEAYIKELKNNVDLIINLQGDMPNIKPNSISKLVKLMQNNDCDIGTLASYITDKNGIIHGGVGKVGFEPAAIRENVEALIADLKKAKPASAKGIYLKKVTISTTMGAGIQIDQASLDV